MAWWSDLASDWLHIICFHACILVISSDLMFTSSVDLSGDSMQSYSVRHKLQCDGFPLILSHTHYWYKQKDWKIFCAKQGSTKA